MTLASGRFSDARAIIITGLLFAILMSVPAHATTFSIPASLAEATLAESVPTALAPEDLQAADYALEWEGAAAKSGPEGVRVRLGEKSLEWVRVSEVLVIPRGQLLIEIDGASGGRVTSARHSQSLVSDGKTARAELPIALISGEGNPIDLVWTAGAGVAGNFGREGKGSREFHARLHPRFRPRTASAGPHISTDPSCSPFRVSLDPVGVTPLRPDERIYVGCRQVLSEGAEHRTSSLEAFVFWDNPQQPVSIGGVETPPVSDSLWALRLRAKGTPTELSSGDRRLKLSYAIAEHLHLLSVGLGVGPYSYTFDIPNSATHSTTALITLYANYFITESSRIVLFDATPVTSKFWSDLGLYYNTEYLKTLDNRLVMNVMLGAHVLAFDAKDRKNVLFGVPQGFELTYRDTFLKGFNLSAGAFLYPEIQGKSYYNVWFRYGGRGYFAEINYISFHERLEDDRVYSRSFGISFGFPLARFL